MEIQELKNKLTQGKIGLIMVDEKEAQLIADIISTLSSENISMSCAKRVLKLVEEVLPIITKLNQFV